MNTSITTPLQPPGSPAPPSLGESAPPEGGEGFSRVFSRELPSQDARPRQTGAAELPEKERADIACEQDHPRTPAQAAAPAPAQAAGKNAQEMPAGVLPEEQAANAEDPLALLQEPQDGSPALVLPTAPPPGAETLLLKGKPAAADQALLNGPSQTPTPLAALLPGAGKTAGGLPLNETPATAESGNSLPPEGKDAPPRLSSVLDFLTASSALKLNPAGAGDGAGASASAAESPVLPGLSALSETMNDAGGVPANRAYNPPASSTDLLRSLAQTGTPPQFALHAQAGGGEWQAELGQRIRWLAGLKISSAELQLHPAELGAMEVRILSEDDRTTVSFSSNNPAARELIEASLPRLRELLAGSGLQLAHSEVSQQGARHEQGAFARALRHSGTAAVTATEQSLEAPLPRAISGLNLVDHYV